MGNLKGNLNYTKNKYVMQLKYYKNLVKMNFFLVVEINSIKFLLQQINSGSVEATKSAIRFLNVLEDTCKVRRNARGG